jgi:hypothetical protein
VCDFVPCVCGNLSIDEATEGEYVDVASDILDVIESFRPEPEYDTETGAYKPKPRMSESEYLEYCAEHENLIDSMLTWVSCLQGSPNYNQRVFAIQDLTPIGRGKFVGDYYYTKYGFVANELDTDGYGHITHWVSFDEVRYIP